MAEVETRASGGESAKRKHIVWNEENLSYNEANKSAKMKIDEPDTPWASPPKELFEDPEHDGADVVAAMDDVADRLKAIDAEAGGPGDAGPSGPSRVELKGEWDSSDDEDDEDEARRRQKLAFPDPGGSGGSGGSGDAESSDEDEDEGAIDDADRVLKARLFEAQRKSHQCTFRGMMARGRALLDEDEDEGE